MLWPERVAVGLRRIAATALLLATAIAAEAGHRAMPAFAPEIRPLAGTWKHVHHADGKDVPLYLVIKEEKGVLRLRFQLPARDKVYSSDWDGQIEVDIQVNITEKRKVEYRVETQPPAIAIHEQLRYSGSDQRYAADIHAAYELDASGTLWYRCRSFTQGKKEMTCPAPLEYQRVSSDTRWPD